MPSVSINPQPRVYVLRHLVEDVGVVVLGGEAGVAVAQAVHHGAAGDDDGGEQSVDAVLERRGLERDGGWVDGGRTGDIRDISWTP